MTIKGLLVKKGFKVIEVSGNHEQWGVDKYNSIENNFGINKINWIENDDLSKKM